MAMINLLPPEEKRQLRAARTNTLLLRYNIALLIVFGLLALATAFVYFYLSNTRATAEQTISDNQAKAASYAPVASQAQEFRNNLSVAKQILGNEVTYSKVILSIAGLMPAGTVLDKLALDSKNFGTPMTLTAQAKSYDNAIQLKESFQSSPLFSDVHFESITSSEGNTGYPFTVNLSVTIKKDAAK
ncbi:MAG TPA: PilN domain-containing protein [Candidatus Saccharimonadales bacterium]|nr:PilN domain-containing protein [Candidatus Saccharimonadales bacterium]